MPEWLTNIGMILFVAFFFGFSVFIHEFGHLLAAVWRGLHVDKFSIGFGKRIIGFKRKGVDFIIGWLPFGGYVALPQMEPTDEPQSSDGTVLPSSKPLDRVIVALAGPLFNLLFAFTLAVVLWKCGKPISPPLEKIVISDIPETSVDYKAGLRSGDQIININGQKLKNFQQMQKNYILDETITLLVERDGKQITLGPFEPEKDPDMFNYALPPFTSKPKYAPQKAIIKSVIKKDEKSGDELPAYAAGFRAGDIITKVNGKKITYREDVSLAIDEYKGQEMTFTVSRDTEEKEIKITPKKIVKKKIGLSFIRFPKVHQIILDTPAYKNGLRRWDNITKINGKAVTTLEAFEKEIQKQNGKAVSISVKRQDKEIDFEVKSQYEFFMIGVAWQRYRVTHTPIKQFKDVFGETFLTLKALFNRKVDVGGLSGPIGIAQGIYQQFKHLGWRAALAFIFMINISLAIFNLLPLPVLDGGHIFIALAELISRRKVPARLLQPVTMIFILFFFSLMIYVTMNDVKRAGFEIKVVKNSTVVEPPSPPIC